MPSAANSTTSAGTRPRGEANVSKTRRVVVEIREDLHQELRKLAIMNDLKLYMLVNEVFDETLNDQERLKAVIKKVKLQANYATQG